MVKKPKKLEVGQLWGHWDGDKLGSGFLIVESEDNMTPHLRGMWIEKGSCHLRITNYTIEPSDMRLVSDHEYLGMLDEEWGESLLGALSNALQT